MTAHYQNSSGIAVITLDNPPINSLGYATRVAIDAGSMMSDERMPPLGPK